MQTSNEIISDFLWIPENVLEMKTDSAKMREVYDQIQSVASTNATVLLTGESGTGKGIVARLIHRLSKRVGKPFISVHCGAIPDTLLESTLFGHVKGAFTGAIRDKQGKFQVANTGTILLDEIGTISPSSQIKLLQILQDRIVQRVGEDEISQVNVRVIAITNEDLATLCATNRFRKDLYYRLNVFPIEIPPLRDRKEDIPSLAYSFMNHLRGFYEKQIMDIEPALLKAFEIYSWPGNIREMENLIERAYILETKSELTSKSLSVDMLDIVNDHHQIPQATSISDMTLAEVRKQAIAKIEQEYLKALLLLNRGKINTTAAAAGVSARQLSKLLQKYHLKKDEFKKASAQTST